MLYALLAVLRPSASGLPGMAVQADGMIKLAERFAMDSRLTEGRMPLKTAAGGKTMMLVERLANESRLAVIGDAVLTGAVRALADRFALDPEERAEASLEVLNLRHSAKRNSANVPVNSTTSASRMQGWDSNICVHCVVPRSDTRKGLALTLRKAAWAAKLPDAR